MRPVTRDEIVGLDAYAELREAYRAAVIAHKRSRRVAVGEKVTLVFEDHETLRFQIQEMTWIERISDPGKVQQELDVYNELMPGEDELTATLFVEITDMPRIRPELDRLVGIDEHVALVIGAGGEEAVIPARFDPKQMEEDRISAVQYLRFPFTREQVRRFSDPAVPARVRIDHPAYTREAPIPPGVRDSLRETLAGGPAPLHPRRGPTPEPKDEVLFETPRVRVLRPARPAARAHVIVEPREATGSLLDADAELLRELLEAVRRVATTLVDDHGRCRVQTDLGPEAGPPRWHLLAPDA